MMSSDNDKEDSIGVLSKSLKTTTEEMESILQEAKRYVQGKNAEIAIL